MGMEEKALVFRAEGGAWARIRPVRGTLTRLRLIPVEGGDLMELTAQSCQTLSQEAGVRPEEDGAWSLFGESDRATQPGGGE